MLNNELNRKVVYKNNSKENNKFNGVIDFNSSCGKDNNAYKVVGSNAIKLMPVDSGEDRSIRLVTENYSGSSTLSHNNVPVGSKWLVRFCVFALIILGFIMGGFVASSGFSGVDGNYIEYSVAQGDTVWEVASANSNGDDVSNVVREIMEVNGLENDTLHVGQSILVPIVEK